MGVEVVRVEAVAEVGGKRQWHLRTGAGHAARQDRIRPGQHFRADVRPPLIDRSALRIDRVCDEAGDDVDPPAMGYAWYCLTAR